MTMRMRRKVLPSSTKRLELRCTQYPKGGSPTDQLYVYTMRCEVDEDYSLFFSSRIGEFGPTIFILLAQVSISIPLLAPRLSAHGPYLGRPS
jgi:hypothetical protein